jgi:fumarylacetoacetase
VSPPDKRLDDTHDPALRSWVPSANVEGGDFPVQNLPLGVFRTAGESGARIGVAIGERVLDLRRCHEARLFDAVTLGQASAEPLLNPLLELGPDAWHALRRQVSSWLREGGAAGGRKRALETALVERAGIEMALPAAIGDYTDFYASIFHATNVGSMFRPDEPLLPNYRHVPIGYHGRASSIVPSGTPVRRPCGQTKPEAEMEPQFGATKRLDYELEIAALVGRGNQQGSPIPIEEAEDHVLGLCLLNDWSARDIQAWEYQPLGPFLAKSFATTISPWIVMLDALEPFRAPGPSRESSDPKPLAYLEDVDAPPRGGIDVRLEVALSTEGMRRDGRQPHVISRSSARHLYWTIAQLVTHHASNGCNLRPGDLIASGTVSGPTRDSRGCLLELTWRGTEPLTLPSGETRRFLEDGDEVVFRGWCEREGAVRIGFGECRGIIMPARSPGGDRRG